MDIHKLEKQIALTRLDNTDEPFYSDCVEKEICQRVMEQAGLWFENLHANDDAGQIASAICYLTAAVNQLTRTIAMKS